MRCTRRAISLVAMLFLGTACGCTHLRIQHKSDDGNWAIDAPCCCPFGGKCMKLPSTIMLACFHMFLLVSTHFIGCWWEAKDGHALQNIQSTKVGTVHSRVSKIRREAQQDSTKCQETLPGALNFTVKTHVVFNLCSLRIEWPAWDFCNLIFNLGLLRLLFSLRPQCQYHRVTTEGLRTDCIYSYTWVILA